MKSQIGKKKLLKNKKIYNENMQKASDEIRGLRALLERAETETRKPAAPQPASQPAQKTYTQDHIDRMQSYYNQESARITAKFNELAESLTVARENENLAQQKYAELQVM
jgi:hypothetical protein